MTVTNLLLYIILTTWNFFLTNKKTIFVYLNLQNVHPGDSFKKLT